MDWKTEWKKLAVIAVVFAGCFYLPVGTQRFDNAILESLRLVRWYAREHVLLCLVPAFFIAGAISAFISKASVMKYLGPKAGKPLAYAVASVSGSILAVCSCTVLPLFAGIYTMGAGLGPATAFLYSGPAINVMAILLTARVLGVQLGVARAVGAIVFSIVIGLLMQMIFRREERQTADTAGAFGDPEAAHSLRRSAVHIALMVGILVFANWAKPQHGSGVWHAVYTAKWAITGAFAAGLGIVLVRWLGVRWWKVSAAAIPPIVLAAAAPHTPLLSFAAGVIGLSVVTATGNAQARNWLESSWSYAKAILPLLLLGVLVAGVLLGRPGHEGLIPSAWVSRAVGGNSLAANMFASVAGAFMYFATLTEVPILQGLIGSGMGKGPALALLLAGPALSLPNMLVIRSVLGTRKTTVYVCLVIAMATFCGVVFGTFAPGN